MRPGPDLDAAKMRFDAALMIRTNIERARVALAGVAPALPLEERVAALRAIEARGLVERAGVNLSGWKITTAGLLAVGKMEAA